MSDIRPPASPGVAPNDVAAAAHAVENVVPRNHLVHMPLMRLNVLSHPGDAAEVADTAGESEDDSPFMQGQRRSGQPPQAPRCTVSQPRVPLDVGTNSSGVSTPLGRSPPTSLPQPHQVVGLPSHELNGRCTRMWYNQLPGDLGMSMREREGSTSFVVSAGDGFKQGIDSTDSSVDPKHDGHNGQGSTVSREPTSPFVAASSKPCETGSRQSHSSTTKDTRLRSQAHEDIVRNAMLEARVTIEGQRQMSRSLSKRVSKVVSGRAREREANTTPTKTVPAVKQRRVPAAHVGLHTLGRNKSESMSQERDDKCMD